MADIVDTLICGSRTLSLGSPAVMGILNVTPDSFSDGGQFDKLERAVARAQQMVEQGAVIIDVGGESTRPNAEPVPVDEELARVIPLVDALVKEVDAIISVDTSKPEVMRAAIEAGCHMINDVSALQAEGAIEVVAQSSVAVVLMHMQGEPRVMQQAPRYNNVTLDVGRFLLSRARACEESGIDRARIVVDPGFGFGKTLEHNLSLFQALPLLSRLSYPCLVGVSRKSMLGSLLDKPVHHRLIGSVTLAALAAERGAAILRVHDVSETVDALKVVAALVTHND